MALITKAIIRSSALSRSVFVRSFSVSALRTQARPLDSEFPVLTDPLMENKQLPSFMVGTENGFLPRQEPLAQLPERFEKLESLLQRMPIRCRDGSPGLLAHGQFGDAVMSELPVYNVDDIQDNQLLSALFRDYTFAASAYLLEPCDIMYRSKDDYGLGRQILPENIAVPLVKVSEKIHSKPFMEYALSYSLYNWKRLNPTAGLSYDNLDIVRGFAGSASEAGFILNHVTMVAYSGDLVKYSLAIMDAVSNSNREQFDNSMRMLNRTYEFINNEMEMMWSRSEPGDYMKFRTFIMGTKNQPMFPNGVVYEGVSDTPLFYRGESGANDSMVPLGDNLLQLTSHMPKNPLTEVLRDFRSYRPTNHKEFLEYVQERAEQVGVRDYALKDDNSAALYLSNVDQIRAFRHRHWNFTKSYIIKHTQHAVATGGSPITTWLPNQLGTVLDQMIEVGNTINRNNLTEENQMALDAIWKRAEAQKRVLNREVATLKQAYKDQDKV
ncbi:unnamed protein product [Umbelopsis ramanniana]